MARGKAADDIWLVLPVGPSVNQKYISRKFVVSKEWRNYRVVVGTICTNEKIRPLSGDLSMSIVWYRARKAGDIDSKIKCLLDALQTFAYKSDDQVKELTISRKEDPEAPRMVVNIKKWTE